MSYEIGAVRASASLDSTAFDAGVRSARSSLKVLQGGFQETAREALRSVEGMASGSDKAMSRVSLATRNQTSVFAALDRETKKTSATTRSWVSQLDRQAKSFDRLRSSLDPLFASSKQYEGAVERVETAVRIGIVSQEEANRVLDQAAQKYLGLVPAAEQARQAEERAAQETRNLRTAYESTRASLDPLYASSQRYAAVQTQMNAATAAGAISQREASMVMDQASARYLGTAKAASKYGASMQSGAHHTANLGYQINDIGVMMAAGQNPFILAVQQGTQVSQVFGQMSASGQSLSSGLRSAFMSVVSPMALVTIGAIAGTAALVQWGVSAFGASSDSETLDDSVKELDKSFNEYLQTADLAKSSLVDLRKEYGRNAEAVREVYGELLKVSEQMALNDLDAAIGEAAGSLTSLVALVGELSEARMELGSALATGLEGAPLPKAELDALEAQVSQVLGTIQDGFGLVSAEAYRVKDAIDAMNRASTSEEAALAARQLSIAISSSYEGARRIPEEMGVIATMAAKVFTTFSRIDNTSRDISLSVSRTGDDTHSALGSTISWARQMSGVRFEVEGIVSAFNAINGGLISGAAKQVELQALRAGDSLRDARRAADEFQSSLELDQTIANLESNWGAVGSAIGEVLTLGNQAAQNLDAELDTQREAARELEKASGAAGAASKGALVDITAEIASRKILLGLTDDQRQKYQAILTVQQKLGKDAGKYSAQQIDYLADQLVALDDHEAALERIKDLQGQWSEQITRTAFEGGSLSDTVEGMLRDIAYQFAHSKIVLPIIASVTGILGLDQLIGGGAVAGATSGSTGTGLLGGLLGGGGLLGSLSAGAGLGFSTLLSGGIGGYGALLGAQGAAALAGSTSAMVGLTGALGPVALLAGGIYALSKAFSRKYAGTAIRGSLGSEGFDGTQFDFHKGGAFRSNSEVHKPLAAEVEAMLDGAMVGVTDGLTNMAGTLGLSADALADFNGTGFTLWIHDKSQEEIQKALTDRINATAEEMAALVLTTDEFSQAGESALETINRLGSSLLAVNDMMDLLGGQDFTSSLGGADTASSLADQFGGLDAMKATVGSYWDAYYSDLERQETIARRLGEQFTALNVTMPETRDGFRALVEAQNLLTDEGRSTYASLLGLAGTFDQLTTMTEQANGAVEEEVGNLSERLGLQRQLYTLQGLDAELKELQLSQLDEGNRSLQVRIWGLQEEQAVQKEASGLQSQLMKALGQTEELRALELAALNPANRALQERIWGLEDESKLIDRLGGDVSTAMGVVSDVIGTEIERIEGDARERLDRLNIELDEASSQADAARSSIIGFINELEENSVGAFRRMRDQITSLLDQRAVISRLPELSSYRASQAQIFDFATGSEFTEEQLSAALGGLSGDTSQYFGSFADYARDAAATNQALRDLEGVTDNSIAQAESEIEVLRKTYQLEDAGFATIDQAIAALEAHTASAEQIEREIGVLEGWRDQQVATLEAQLEAAQLQADAALGITDALAGMEGAMDVVGQSLTALQGAISSLNTVKSAMTPNQTRNHAIANQTGNVSDLWIYEQRILGTPIEDQTDWERGVWGDLKGRGFSGGGYTGNGPRSGGLDNEGGRLALLHPQETVIDHYRGQSLGGDMSGLMQEVSALRRDFLQAISELRRDNNTGHAMNSKWNQKSAQSLDTVERVGIQTREAS